MSGLGNVECVDWQIGVQRKLAAGETAIIAFDRPVGQPPFDTIVQRFLLTVAPPHTSPEGVVEVLRRPRRGDRIAVDEIVRLVVKAAQACHVWAGLLVTKREGAKPWGQAHCYLCGRDFWTRYRHDLDHDCEGHAPQNWDEAMALATKMDEEPKGRP